VFDSLENSEGSVGWPASRARRTQELVREEQSRAGA